MSNPRKTPAAAAYIGCSPSFLNKDRAKGGKRRVPFRRNGRSILYDEPDLDAYKAANRVSANAESRRQHNEKLSTTTERERAPP
jgi:hypothetical protein